MAGLRDTWVHRAAKRLLPAGLYPRNVIGRAIVRRTGRAVHTGPFKGMRYAPDSVGSVYYPKLLGTYEKELHPAVEEAVAAAPRLVVDVGTAEGYYAVGLALRLPAARVVGFEMDPAGRRLVADMARANGVADRVEVRGRCEPADLARAVAAGPGPAATLVVCDTEGYEDKLLDPAAVPGLAGCHILVELHEFAAPGVTGRLKARFDRTHQVAHVWQTDRTRADYPFPIWYTAILPAAYAAYSVREHRPERMSWLWMRPAAGGA